MKFQKNVKVTIEIEGEEPKVFDYARASVHVRNDTAEIEPEPGSRARSFYVDGQTLFIHGKTAHHFLSDIEYKDKLRYTDKLLGCGHKCDNRGSELGGLVLSLVRWVEEHD